MKRSLCFAGIVWLGMLYVFVPALDAAAEGLQYLDPNDPSFRRCQLIANPSRWNCFNVGLANANLSNRMLPSARFESVDLEAADFSGSDLTGAGFPCNRAMLANFKNALLAGTNFVGTNLTRADFAGANLSFVTFGDISPCYLSYSSTNTMFGVNLTGANLRSSTLTAWHDPRSPWNPGASYDRRRDQLGFYMPLEMRRADLTNATLNKVTFIEVDLRLSTFIGTKMEQVEFLGGNLACSVFTNVQLIKRSGFLNGTNLAGADFTDNDLTDVRFDKAILTGAIFVRANLTRALMYGADLTYADLTGAKLDETDLQQVNLSGAIWTDGTTRCAQGSIGQCIADGPTMPPDPNALPDRPKGAAYLAWATGGAYDYCPYSTIDYSDYPPGWKVR